MFKKRSLVSIKIKNKEHKAPFSNKLLLAHKSAILVKQDT
jgi:hypothetical protein